MCSKMTVVMCDTDEGITVFPIHLSRVKSDENVGGNGAYCEESDRSRKYECFPLKSFPGEYEWCNFVVSYRYGDKRDDSVLHSYFARYKWHYIVDLVKNCYSGLHETCRPGDFYFPLFPFLFVPGRYKVGLYRT
jgi:hypothetical protein